MEVIRIVAPIGDHVPSINDADVESAAGASAGLRFVADLDFCRPPENQDLDICLGRLKTALGGLRPASQIGVFAFGPIPLLMAAGRLLGDKGPATVFDWHRHSQGWKWEPDPGEDLGWRVNRPGCPQETEDVALLLSISGQVTPREVRGALQASFDVFEISIARPALDVVRTEAQLQSFADLWRQVLAEIRAQYGPTVRIHVFPAIPLAIAIECGRRMLPKADPSLHVYDLKGGAFNYALTLAADGVNRDAKLAAPKSVDGVVIVALGEEAEQVLGFFPESLQVPDGVHGGTDFITRCQKPGGEATLAIRVVGEMGISNAQLAADRAITRWNPSFVAMVGIAGSLSDDLLLADVLIADQADAYDANLKAIEGAAGDFDLNHRGEVFRAPHGLMQGIRQLGLTHGDEFRRWTEEGAKDLAINVDQQATEAMIGAESVRCAPGLIIGHLATGSILGASTAFGAWLKGRDGNLKALEMEAGGLARAAEKRLQEVRWLVIRGISDFADSGKAALEKSTKGAIRGLATRNAARLLKLLLTTGIVT